jgi:hypothetical protein
LASTDLPRPYRVWGYPLTPLIFLAIEGWMIWNLLTNPSTRGPSLLGLGTALLGLVVYFFSPKARPVSSHDKLMKYRFFLPLLFVAASALHSRRPSTKRRVCSPGSRSRDHLLR